MFALCANINDLEVVMVQRSVFVLFDFRITYSTVLNNTQQYSTVLNSSQQYSTVLNSTQQYSTVLQTLVDPFPPCRLGSNPPSSSSQQCSDGALPATAMLYKVSRASRYTSLCFGEITLQLLARTERKPTIRDKPVYAYMHAPAYPLRMRMQISVSHKPS